ncbi:unnamed protein product [Rotaria socialis]|uniref:Uncharacterized protein n=1 Tax=Rotaria socialis TaxID=392032 RepID=A0A821NQL7_9BILA|nr:unnamed protein product [Rotaria socialis]CAF4678244.1 unnamed protein product [Rotaria socialis]CAF4789063.1 unnamed protein product [Rotaria socialis]CAF4923972.1 unnamed protein product [Rotaria socialis]
MDNCLNNVSDQMVARLPNFKYIKRNIQRQRQKNDLPQIPHDKNFTMVPTSLTMTIRNDAFLQFHSGPGDHRLIIFSSPEQLKILEETEEILIDGTFKITPVIFTQLYTMHGVYRNCVFPLVFALLSDKQQQTYQREQLMLSKELLTHCRYQDLGLKTNYENDSKFAYDVNKIAALAFLQPGDVNQGFDD